MWFRALTKILLSPDFWAFVVLFVLKSRKIIFKKKIMSEDIIDSVPVPVSVSVSDPVTLDQLLPADDAKLQPLGLPRGSVRAILTLLFTVAMLVSFFFPSVQATIPEWVWACWTGLLGYYLGYRTDNSPARKII